MRILLVALFFLASPALAAEETVAAVVAKPSRPSSFHWEAAVGFPTLLGARLSRDIGSMYRVGVAFGALPLSLLINAAGVLPSGSISDQYSIVFEPRLDFLAPALFFDVRPWGEDTYLRFEFAVLIAAAGGEALLKNLSTSQMSNVSSIEATLFQPRLGITIVQCLHRGESSRLELAIGVSYAIATALNVSVTGALNSYLNVAPEFRPSIQDGLANASNELARVLRDGPLSGRFLPAVTVQWAW